MTRDKGMDDVISVVASDAAKTDIPMMIGNRAFASDDRATFNR